MAISYTQTDTAAVCTIAPHTKAIDGGTAGSTPLSQSIIASAVGASGPKFELIINSGTTGNSGTLTYNLDITTANMNLTWSGIKVEQQNSACSIVATLANSTGLGISLGTTGVKIGTVSISAATFSAGDVVRVTALIDNGAMSSQSIGWTPDQNIDSPFTAAAANVGTVTATATVSGVSQATAVSPATVTATSAVNGVGAAQDLTTGTINASATVSGTGVAAIVAPGAITAQSTVSGIGQSTATGVGSINAVSVVNGISNALAVSPATVNAVSSVNGVGQSTAQTTGTITAQSTVSGTAEAAVIGSGSITAQASVSGVGDFLAGGASIGTVSSQATVNGIGAADVLATGNVVSQSVVAGVGMSIIAEQPQAIGGGMWPWRWDAIDEELLRRKSREEQRRIRIQLGIIPPDTEEEAESASQELVKPDIVPAIYRRPLLDEKEFTELVMRRVREEQSRLRAERIEERNRERINRLWQEAAEHELDKVVTQYRKRKAKRFDEDVLLLLS